MQVQFNLSKKVALGLYGVGLIILALLVSTLVPSGKIDPTFTQILMAALCFFTGMGGLVCVLCASIWYFSEDERR